MFRATLCSSLGGHLY